MSLKTPNKIRNLQRKLYYKAKQEEGFRFYALYDKIYRQDILEHAYRLVHANGGSPGIDGVSSRAIEKTQERETNSSPNWHSNWKAEATQPMQ